MSRDLLQQLLAQAGQTGRGGIWGTNNNGVASPARGRSPLTGGLQQMQMLRAFQNGASMDQLQGMNPFTPRPMQFLPPAITPYSWAKDPNNPANKPQAPIPGVGANGGSNNYAGGEGAGSSPDGGLDAAGVDGIGATGIGIGTAGIGENAAVGEGGGGGGGGAK